MGILTHCRYPINIVCLTHTSSMYPPFYLSSSLSSDNLFFSVEDGLTKSQNIQYRNIDEHDGSICLYHFNNQSKYGKQLEFVNLNFTVLLFRECNAKFFGFYSYYTSNFRIFYLYLRNASSVCITFCFCKCRSILLITRENRDVVRRVFVYLLL